ncbi:MAG: ANTAR domain-containing protein [Ruminococcus sp.]|nr:ANTAR domain-containing protein [Ruminococcus sp.]
MELKLRRYHMLLVSSQPKFNEETKLLIGERTKIEMELEGSISSAKRLLADRDTDILVINSPLPDENGIRFAIERASSGGMAVLLLIPEKYYTEVFERVAPFGVFTLAKPMSRQLMNQALDWLESARERMKSVKKKSVSIEEKMAEIRLVNRAKWVLITEQGLSEDDAHHFIQKAAMDRSLSKGSVAQEIIDNSKQK